MEVKGEVEQLREHALQTDAIYVAVNAVNHLFTSIMNADTNRSTRSYSGNISFESTEERSNWYNMVHRRVMDEINHRIEEI